MGYNPNNPNGQATKANSQPVTLASDQNNALETGGNLATLATASASQATAANQTTGNTSLSTIATNTGTTATNSATAAKDGTDITTPTAMPAGGVGIRGWLSAIWTKLNGTLAVTGTFWQATQPVSAASLPLPTGAAQDATLTGGTVRTKVTDGTTNAAVKAASTAAVAADPALVVAISPNNTVPVSLATAPTTPVTGTFWQATQPVSLATNTPVIAAGSALIGKVGIDQTTAGTTNAVSVAQVGATTVATGNGVVGAGVQRVAIASDNSTIPVSIATAPTTPITQSDTVGTGTISATDVLGGVPGGAGVLIATAPTANSFVGMAIPGGGSQVDIQILGTATGTYYFEHSMDSTTGSDGNWIATNFRQTGIVNTVLGYSATTNGIFRGNSAGFKWVRVRNVGGTTPSNAITIRVSNGGGTVFQNASTPAGTNIMGKVGIDQTTPGTTNAVNLVSRAAGGATTYTLISAATTNATNIKASAGTIYGIQASNTGGAVAFLKIYAKATSPTVGTDTAVKTLIIPAGGGIVVPINAIGIAVATGISIAITGLATTADATAVALAQVVVNIDYV